MFSRVRTAIRTPAIRTISSPFSGPSAVLISLFLSSLSAFRTVRLPPEEWLWIAFVAQPPIPPSASGTLISLSFFLILFPVMWRCLLVLLSISAVSSFDNKMSWCDYWYRRGVARSECTKPRQQHWSLIPKQQETDKNIFSMPICDVVTDWGRCQRSDHCPLGLLCWVHGNPCCTPQFTKNNGIDESGQCPSQQAMGIQCNTRSPVNWCYIDSDCHRFNSLQKCCPSGCGYNMCVRTSPPLDLQSRMTALITVPSQCPRMDSLPITCSGTHGVSWCVSDKDCYSNGAMIRNCCPTTCGYNVCLLKLDDSRWIIA